MPPLEPLTFRLSPCEAAEMIAQHLGDRLPPEYRAAGVRVWVEATTDGIEAVYGVKPKKPSWLERLATMQRRQR